MYLRKSLTYDLYYKIIFRQSFLCLIHFAPELVSIEKNFSDNIPVYPETFFFKEKNYYLCNIVVILNMKTIHFRLFGMYFLCNYNRPVKLGNCYSSINAQPSKGLNGEVFILFVTPSFFTKGSIDLNFRWVAVHY